MSNIDWGKAPEGADFHFQPKRKGDVGGFYAIASTHDRFVSQSGSYILFSNMSSVADLFVVNSRPEAVPAWNGIGLPPVGTVCEIKRSANWTEVEVIAHYNGQAVIAFDGDVELRDHSELRPIRTPEQIAADKREKDAEELFLTINWNDSASTWANLSRGRRDDYFKAIDAGYRKTDVQ